MPSVSASRHSVPVDFSSALTMLTLARHSAICKEQAHNTLMCKLTLHETPNIKGTYCTCKSTLHTNVHKHKTQQRLQKMPTSTKHICTHTGTLHSQISQASTNTHTQEHLQHTQAPMQHCAQEQAQALLHQGRHKASCSRHLARGKRETKCSLGRLHAALMNKSHFVAYAHNTAYIP